MRNEPNPNTGSHCVCVFALSHLLRAFLFILSDAIYNITCRWVHVSQKEHFLCLFLSHSFSDALSVFLCSRTTFTSIVCECVSWNCINEQRFSNRNGAKCQGKTGKISVCLEILLHHSGKWFAIDFIHSFFVLFACFARSSFLSISVVIWIGAQ